MDNSLKYDLPTYSMPADLKSQIEASHKRVIKCIEMMTELDKKNLINVN